MDHVTRCVTMGGGGGKREERKKCLLLETSVFGLVMLKKMTEEVHTGNNNEIVTR